MNEAMLQENTCNPLDEFVSRRGLWLGMSPREINMKEESCQLIIDLLHACPLLSGFHRLPYLNHMTILLGVLLSSPIFYHSPTHDSRLNSFHLNQYGKHRESTTCSKILKQEIAQSLSGIAVVLKAIIFRSLPSMDHVNIVFGKTTYQITSPHLEIITVIIHPLICQTSEKTRDFYPIKSPGGSFNVRQERTFSYAVLQDSKIICVLGHSNQLNIIISDYNTFSFQIEITF